MYCFFQWWQILIDFGVYYDRQLCFIEAGSSHSVELWYKFLAFLIFSCSLRFFTHFHFIYVRLELTKYYFCSLMKQEKLQKSKKSHTVLRFVRKEQITSTLFCFVLSVFISSCLQSTSKRESLLTTKYKCHILFILVNYRNNFTFPTSVFCVTFLSFSNEAKTKNESVNNNTLYLPGEKKRNRR